MICPLTSVFPLATVSPFLKRIEPSIPETISFFAVNRYSISVMALPVSLSVLLMMIFPLG